MFRWWIAITAACLLLVPAVARAAWMTADMEDGCAHDPSNPQLAISYARLHGANAIRIVFGGPDMVWGDGSWHGTWADVRACFQAARAAGYRTYLSLQWDRAIGAAASPAQVRWFVGGAMAQVGRWTNWVSVGNEPDLAGISPSLYRQAWTAAAGYLATWWPHVWRVFGEAAAGGWWLRAAWNAGSSRPWRANAIGFHCYDFDGSLWTAPQTAVWAASRGRQAYCSEMAPDTYAAIGAGESLASYNNWVGWMGAHVRNLTMFSAYCWPAINPGY